MTSTNARTSFRIAAAAVLTAGLVAGSGIAAQASQGSGKDDRGRVKASGSCSAKATWKLKAKGDDGRVEVELEVDSNKAGQTWSVRIDDNGTAVVSKNAVTRGASGSFSIERRIADRSGSDTITAVATDTGSGRTCTGSVVFSG